MQFLHLVISIAIPFSKSNPNKYRFPFSSAPKSIENGNPSFLVARLTVVDRLVSALDGVTFNDASSR